jgi:hypothetical protein
LRSGALAAGFATSAANLRHVATVPAHCFSTLATCRARFVRSELMSISGFVRSSPALAGDIALLLGIHCSKPSITGFPTSVFGHNNPFFKPKSLLRSDFPITAALTPKYQDDISPIDYSTKLRFVRVKCI